MTFFLDFSHLCFYAGFGSLDLGFVCHELLPDPEISSDTEDVDVEVTSIVAIIKLALLFPAADCRNLHSLVSV